MNQPAHAACPRPARIHEQLQQYWHELRGERALPLESEINTDALGAAWAACFLVSVHDGTFTYDYLGPALRAAYGDDAATREIAQALVYPHPPSLLATFQRACREAVPIIDEGEFTNRHGTLVRSRCCVLPLGARGRKGVAFLLGGMKWKAC
jgi:hypothetical protein